MYMTHHLIYNNNIIIFIIGSLIKELNKAHQPVVVYFHSWAVVSPIYKS